MSNALRAEVRRLLARRLTVVALLGVLAVIGLFQLQVNAMVKPPSAEDIAMAQSSYDEYLQDWEANHEEWEAECLDSGGTGEECAEPRPQASDWGLAATPYDQAVPTAVSFGVYLGGLVIFVVAASFIGAEVSTGSLANWLTFVPNRGRVYASKLVVAGVFALLVGLLVGAVTVGVSALITLAHGQSLTGLEEVAGMAARGSLVVFVFGVLGFCIGMLTGSTGATMGVLLGGIFVIFVHSVLQFASAWAQRLSPWTPNLNLTAILENGTTYLAPSGSEPVPDDSGQTGVEATLSLSHGLGYWAVLLAILIVITWVVFRRRDVT